jgi:hypothetical protein
MANEQVSDFDTGLRILARMIARAYRQELAEKRATQSKISNEKKEENDANKGNIRDRKVAKVRQDKTRNQKEE